MTKEEIDRLFEIYDNEEFEELLDIIKDDKLKEKAMQYDDLEEFSEEEEDNIVIAIYSQIPPELLDYFCEKAIISSNDYFICDEQIREEQIKRFETKVEEIIKSDDDTKIKFLENLGDYNKYAIKVAQTLSDEKKLEFIDNKDAYCQCEVAKKITDSDIKLKAIAKIKEDNSYYRSDVALTIEDETVRLDAIDFLNDDFHRAKVAKSITEDQELKLKSLDKIDKPMYKAEVAVTMEDSEIKLKSLDKIDEPMYKAKVAVTIEDSEIKLKSLDKIDEPMYKAEVAVTMEDSEIKLKSLDKIDDIRFEADVIRTVTDIEDKKKLLDRYKKPNDKLFILQNSFKEEEVVKLAKNMLQNDPNQAGPIVNILSEQRKIKMLQEDGILESDNKKSIIIKTVSEKSRVGLINLLNNDKNKLDIIGTIKETENIKKALELTTFSETKTQNEAKATANLLEDSLNLEKTKNKYINDEIEIQRIGLPEDMTIGVELETEGEMAVFLRHKMKIGNWKGVGDGSIPYGVEVVSPILHDTEEDMQSLENICNAMRKAGLESTEKCGGHIHIGADYLKDNPQAFENFLTIWNECEELFYKMGNEKGNVPRDKITKWAQTSHSDLEQFSSGGTVNVKSNSDIENIRTYLVTKEGKYRGLNLGHYGEEGKNTIEFRIPNGTINPKTIKENIKLFGSLMQISKEMALNPEYKKEEFETLMDRGLTEGEKVEALLNLLFDDEQTKSIYRERWDSVKDEKIFDELTAGQTPTFERGNYKIENKQDIKEVANSEEAIEEMSGVAEEVRREVKEREQQSQLSNSTSIEDSAESR